MKIQLAGPGDQIPEFAILPSDVGIVAGWLLQLEDGEPFVKAEYVAQGFTNFDVWCIGAAGGNGGTYPNAQATNLGGGGGGGGLHHVSGLLADLPDSCDVVVGEAGADGSDSNGANPMLPTIVDGEIATPLELTPNPAYTPETSGVDGGGSSFGDICMASGGQGGWIPAMDALVVAYDYGPDDYNEWHRRITSGMLGGNGGTGGIGGTMDVGGGGLGGVSFWDQECELPRVKRGYTKPADGVWDSDTGIGGGGGGGAGGTYIARNASEGDFSNTQYSVAQKIAADGAKGSFYFGDTSMFGIGEKSAILLPTTAPRVKPGHGGGARINRAHPYGSPAPGSNPNGAVFLRITKVD